MTIETPMGSSINVVDVFITHILIDALANINPAISDRPLFPTEVRIVRAMRLWRFHRSIARAMTKPPIKR